MENKSTGCMECGNNLGGHYNYCKKINKLEVPQTNDVYFNLSNKQITLREIVRCLSLINGAEEIIKDELKNNL